MEDGTIELTATGVFRLCPPTMPAGPEAIAEAATLAIYDAWDREAHKSIQTGGGR